MGHSATTTVPPGNFTGNIPYILAGLLILGYLFYQFGGLLFKTSDCEFDGPCASRTKLRSRTRSRSRSKSRSPATSRSRDRYIRRRREPRCPSCGNKFET